jgi:hypothetical protein
MSVSFGERPFEPVGRTRHLARPGRRPHCGRHGARWSVSCPRTCTSPGATCRFRPACQCGGEIVDLIDELAAELPEPSPRTSGPGSVTGRPTVGRWADRSPTVWLAAASSTPTSAPSCARRSSGIRVLVARGPRGVAFGVSFAYEYPDEQTLRRRLLAPAGVATLVGPEREDAVRAQIVDAMAPYRTAQGGSRLNDEVHFLVARAGCAARWPDRGGRGRV